MFEDKLKEACGLFGIYAKGRKVVEDTFNGLLFLHHRGQESSGIFVSDGQKINGKKGLGLINEVLSDEEIEKYQGHIAIGHARYSTTGSNLLVNSQPICETLKEGQTVCVAHNGNLVNTLELYEFLHSKGCTENLGTTDSALIARLIYFFVSRENQSFHDAIVLTAQKLKGAFSLIIMTEDELIGLRDAFGVRPLVFGQVTEKGRSNRGFFFASESCACRISFRDFQVIHEVKPGQMIIVNQTGYTAKQIMTCPEQSLCIFEFIYFARPDSRMLDVELNTARKNMGAELFKEHPANVDIVIPVQDSGLPAGLGYAAASGIPYDQGFVRNHYSVRTFIQNKQRTRDIGVYLKLAPLPGTLAGKRVALIDDSIVRATTSKKLIDMIFWAGAIEVHMRVSSPPIRFPCFYGIDTTSREELIASTKSVEEIRAVLGATSLGYLSLEGLFRATTLPTNSFCTACFDGSYPIEVPENLKREKHILET